MSISIGDIIGTIRLEDNFSATLEHIGEKAKRALEYFLGFEAVTKVFESIAEATIKNEETIAQLNAVLASTKRAGEGVTEAMEAQAKALSRNSTATADMILQADTVALKFTHIGGEVFPRVIQMATDMAARTGGDVASAMQGLGRAIDDPIRGLTVLRRQGVTFTDEQNEQVKVLMAHGEIVKAQGVLLDALAAKYGGAAAAARNTMGGAIKELKSSFEGLFETMGKDQTGPFRTAVEFLIGRVQYINDHWHLLGATVSEIMEDIVGYIQKVYDALSRFVTDKLDSLAKIGASHPLLATAMGIPPGVTAGIATYSQSIKGATASANLFLSSLKETFSADREASIRKQAEAQAANGRALDLAGEGLKRDAAGASAAAAAAKALADALKQAAVDAAAYKAGDAALAAGKTPAYAQALVDVLKKFPGVSAPVIAQLVELKVKSDAAAAGFKAFSEFKTNIFTPVDLDKLKSAFGRTAEEAHRFWLESLSDSELFAAKIQDATQKMKDLGLSQEIIDNWLKRNGVEQIQVTEGVVQLGSAEDHLNQIIAMQRDMVDNVWQSYVQAGLAAASAVGGAVKTAIVQAFTTGKVDAKAIMQQLVADLVDIFADMVAKIVEKWFLGEELETAKTHLEAAKRAAANRAANASAGGAPAAGGGTTPVGGGGTSMSTLAGAALVAYAAYVVYLGFFQDNMEKFASATIDATGNITNLASHGDKYQQGLQDALTKALQGYKDFAKALNVKMASFGEVQIFSDKNGFVVNQQLFKSMDDAAAYAAAVAIKYGTFDDSVSAMVQAAIRATDAVGKDLAAAIQANVEFAHKLETQNLPQFAQTMQSLAQQMIDDFHHAMDLFGPNMVSGLRGADLSQLGPAVQSVMQYFIGGLQQVYDQLTGHKEDPKQAAEAMRVAYNAQRAIVLAQLTLIYEEIKARIAQYQIFSGLDHGGAGGLGPANGGSSSPTGGQQQQRAISGGRGGGGTGGNPDQGGISTPPPNSSGNPALDALTAVLAEVAAAIAGLPGAIPPGGIKLGGGSGGHGGGAGQTIGEKVQNIEQMVDDVAHAWAQRGMSDFQKTIDDINKKWDDALKGVKGNSHALDDAKKAHDAAIKAANGNAEAIKKANHAYEVEVKNIKNTQDALDQANIARQHEIELAQEQQRKSVTDAVNEAVGNTNAFTELHKKFDGLRKDVSEAGFAGGVAAGMIAALTDAENRAVEALAAQMNADLLGGIAQYIDDATEKAKVLTAQAKIEYAIKMQTWAIQIQILQAQHLATQDLLDAWNYLLAHPPNFDAPPITGGAGGSAPGGEGSGGHWVFNPNTNGWTWVPDSGSGANPHQAALDLLAHYQEAAMDALTRNIKKINDDFATIRASLGDTAEVQAAYTKAIQQAIDEFLAPIKQAQQSINFGPQSIYDPMQQYQMQLATVRDLQAQFRAGNLTNTQSAGQAVQQLLQLAQQVFPTGSEGYASIFREWNGFLNDIVTQTPGTIANPTSVAGMDTLVAINDNQLTALGRIEDGVNRVVAAVGGLRNSNVGQGVA